MLPQDFVFIMFSTLYTSFVYFSKLSFVILTKKKKSVSCSVQNAISAKTEESANQSKGCDAKLQGL